MSAAVPQKLSFYVYNQSGERITGKLPVPITLSDSDPRSQTALSTSALTWGDQIVTLSFKGYGTTATISAAAQGTQLGSLSDVTYLPETATFEPVQGNENFPLAAALARNNTVWMRLSGGGNPSFAQIAKTGTYTIYNDDFVNWQQISVGGMTTDAAGNMWSYEDVGSDGDIVRITQTGAFRHFSIGDVGLVGGMVIGPDKAIWFTIQSDITGYSSVGRITPSGVLTSYHLPDLYPPTTILVGPDSNLWIADGYTIAKVTTAGVVTPYNIPQLPQGAGDFCVGKDGNFWSIMPGGQQQPSIITFNTSGEYVASYPVKISNASAQGCAMDSSGNLYYGDGGTGSVGRISPTGTAVEWPIVPAQNTYRNPDTMTIDAAGLLFYGDGAQYNGGFGKVNTSFW